MSDFKPEKKKNIHQQSPLLPTLYLSKVLLFSFESTARQYYYHIVFCKISDDTRIESKYGNQQRLTNLGKRFDRKIFAKLASKVEGVLLNNNNSLKLIVANTEDTSCLSNNLSYTNCIKWLSGCHVESEIVDKAGARLFG